MYNVCIAQILKKGWYLYTLRNSNSNIIYTKKVETRIFKAIVGKFRRIKSENFI